MMSSGHDVNILINSSNKLRTLIFGTRLNCKFEVDVSSRFFANLFDSVFSEPKGISVRDIRPFSAGMGGVNLSRNL